nr:hypothetical protein [Tanacetum cinerariifolium]GFA59130.1 hypothetical protein [Tanacetum cinerariifolium]
DTEARCFEEKSAKLDARIADVRHDMDNDLYPHMFTAIARRRWVLSHGIRLAVTKCAKSAECRSALGRVISLAIDKGIQEGFEVGIEHGKAGRSVTQDDRGDVDSTLEWQKFQLRLDQVTLSIYSDSGSIIQEMPLSDVVPGVRVAAEARGLCSPSSYVLGGVTIPAPL